MGEEQIPTQATPTTPYIPVNGIYNAGAVPHSRHWNSSTEQLIELFHSLIDELIADGLEFDGSVALLGPDGVTWSVRVLNGNATQLMDWENGFPPDQSAAQDIHLEHWNTTITLSLTTRRLSTDLTFVLRSLCSALLARLRADREEADNKWLTERLTRANKASERQSTLFHLARQLHELNDANAILTEWMTCLDILYPWLPKQLYVSQDHLSPDISVKPLSLDESDHLCTRSFMEGCTVLTDESSEPRTDSRTAAIPLKGKQGVYGVLYLESVSQSLVADDLDFIGLLTDAAGTAFENAQLFEQTVRLVQELQLINEITHRLNQSLKLQDIFQYAVDELTQIFQAEFACILDLDKTRNELVVQASRPDSFMQERVSLDYGFAGLVITKKEPVILSDYRTDCPIDSVWMDATEARSLLASPILDHGKAIGAILVAHREPNYFSYNNYKLLQVLSGHIGLAVTNASLHAEVRRMAATDHLTGLYARHYLDEHIAVFQKNDSCGSLVLLDIDNFKKVNDSHGHQIGDHILIQVSRIIKSCIRDGDIAARWGGEELAVYFPNVNRDQSIHVAERICNKVRLETTPMVTVSCGISDWTRNDAKLSVETLFYRADMALYKAKRSGKNQIRLG
jgi:diguanylate cyclase (GGDEF)-like protein